MRNPDEMSLHLMPQRAATMVEGLVAFSLLQTSKKGFGKESERVRVCVVEREGALCTPKCKFISERLRETRATGQKEPGGRIHAIT